MQATKRGVSEAVRAEVRARAHGWCELFHIIPVEGNQIVHPTGKWHPGHQGIGGAAEDAECNQPKNLLWGCQRCQDLTHTKYTMARIDLDADELEFVDWENRRVPREKIFFHQRPYWLGALEDYPLLTQKLGQWNRLGYEVAALLGKFAPAAGRPPLWNVCPEFEPDPERSDWEEFRRFAPRLGLPGSKAEELARLGLWGEAEGLGGLLAGGDLDALDALRKASTARNKDKRIAGDDFYELAAMAHVDLIGFWDEMDRHRAGKRKRSWVIARPGQEPGDTYVQVRSHERPEIADDEALFRGTIVDGAGREECRDQVGETDVNG